LTVRNAAVAVAKHRGDDCVHSVIEVEVDVGQFPEWCIRDTSRLKIIEYRSY
jgi:hypothetical protein